MSPPLATGLEAGGQVHVGPLLLEDQGRPHRVSAGTGGDRDTPSARPPGPHACTPHASLCLAVLWEQGVLAERGMAGQGSAFSRLAV